MYGKDTTPLLPYLAAHAAARQRLLAAAATTAKIGMDTIDTIHEQNNKHDLEHRLDLFQSLENEFVKRYNAVMESISLLHPPPPPSWSTTNDDEEGGGGVRLKIDQQQQSIHDILHVLDEPSTIVTGMVSESNVLDGLGNLSVNEIEHMIQLYDGLHLLSETSAPEQQQQLGGLNSNSELLPKVTIRLREGCLDTLTRIILTTTKYQNSRNSNNSKHDDSPSAACLGWSIALLSINWCPALIDTALVQPVIMKTRHQECRRTSTTVTGDESSCSSKIEIPIWSNEVDGKGVITLNIPGSAAKRDCIIELRRQLLQQQQQQTTATDDDNDSSPNIIIYIGDSPTDITALLEADIGIIIGNSNTTKYIISLYSYIEIVPIQQLTDDIDSRGTNNNRSNKKHTLWQAECWKEINDAIIRLDESWL
jgi:hypothetical protein